LSTPKITFFSDRTSLARPSAFVRLVSFKRWPRYHTARFRQPLFSKNFTIVCNPLSRNKMKTHFFLVFLLSASLPHPTDAFPRTKRPTETTKIDARPNKKRFFDIPYDSLIDLKQPGHHRPTFPRPSGGQPRPIGAWKRLEDKQDKRGQGKNHASPFPFGNCAFFMPFNFLLICMFSHLPSTPQAQGAARCRTSESTIHARGKHESPQAQLRFFRCLRQRFGKAGQWLSQRQSNPGEAIGSIGVSLLPL
jgi:hypothetical protein